ncbi:hypothetical protein BDQ17DRAFT_1366686, partial [Cyathus striatus]
PTLIRDAHCPFTAVIRRRRSLFIFILACLGIVISFTMPRIPKQPRPDFPLDSVPKPTLEEFPAPVQHEDPSKPLSAPLESKYCKPEECSQGTWELRDRPFNTLADFQVVYPPSHRGVFKICGRRERFHKSQERRLVNLMSWVWKPARGEMLKWDADKFVVRLLQSPGGIIFSGDSISRQHYQQLQYALASAGIDVTEDPDHLPQYNHHRLHQYVLKEGDAMTKYLREKAGVPESRLLRPIYTKMDNHILLGEKEVREIVGELGAQEDFPWRDIYEYFDGWEKFLEDMARPRPGERDTVTEDTVVVLNTGAHWSRGSLYMLPNDGTVEDQQSRVKSAYADMINRMTRRLDAIPRIKVFYRATASAHPSCPSKANPYSNVTHATDMEGDVLEAMGLYAANDNLRNVLWRWDWNRFDVHNRLWEAKVRELAKQRELEGKGPKWFFMDVWNMTIQRPDAHTQNRDKTHQSFDCVHWCVPGVVEQWTKLLNHWLFWTPEIEYS